MIRALIFDLDGTLFDSTEANIKSYGQAFQEAGVTFNEAAYRKSFGLRFPEMMDTIAPALSMTDRERIKQLKSVYYEQNLNLVRPNQGLLALAQASKQAFKTALVTTASRKNVENLLAYFSVPRTLFDAIVTGERVQKGKPDPECYIIAMNALGVSPTESCVFEDSPVGIEAASSAGAFMVKITL